MKGKGSMFLAVNVGNTHIVLGLFDGDTVCQVWRISSVARRTEDEYRILFRHFLQEKIESMQSVRGCLISSVIPRLTHTLSTACRDLFGMQPIVLSHALDIGVKNTYERPEEVGPDRLANAAGGVARYGAPLIIVDSGTATTLDIVSADRAYQGGVIMPGLEMSADALFHGTSRLPRVAITEPRQAIGRTTLDAIGSGLVLGTAGAIDRLIAKVREEMGEPECRAVATGGYGEMLARYCSEVWRADADLTLFGMYKIWQRNAGDC